MSIFRRGDVWWYEFWFTGWRIRESSKSPSKTVAKGAEQKRKRELEAGFNNFTDLRHERIRTFSDMADEYFDAYQLRLPKSARFAEYAIDHLKQLLGSKMLGRVHTILRASTIGTKLIKPRKITSSFSNLEKMRRNPFNPRKSRSTSLRFL
jgi:hypothetical protein